MMKFERIVSCGVTAAERQALRVGRLCGIATGGRTTLSGDAEHANIVRRYGLGAEAGVGQEVVLRNARDADGTLAIGEIEQPLLQQIEAAGRPVFPLVEWFKSSGRAISGWLRACGVRVLNVVGADDGNWERSAGDELLQMMQRLGQGPRGPEGTVVVCDGREFYAVVLWPRQRSWRWEEESGMWMPHEKWQEISAVARGDPGRQPSPRDAVPAELRDVVVGGCWLGMQPDLDTLAALGELGKPAEDLARAKRWGILRLLASAQNLLPEEPALWPELSRLAGRRQREIVGRFGFPPSESSVHVLSKIPEDSADVKTLVALRNLMSNEQALRALRRLQRVNSTVVTILSHPWLRRVVGWRLLREASEIGEDEYGINSAEITLDELRREAQRTGWTERIGTIHSLRRLEQVVDELEAQPTAGWPSCPQRLPGIPGAIEPLTAEMVEEEGQMLEHCAGSYAKPVRLVQCLLFRILPDAALGTGRATVELRPDADGQWHVHQLKGRRSWPVSLETQRFVEVWRFFAHCDTEASGEELRSACLAELAAGSAGTHRAA